MSLKTLLSEDLDAALKEGGEIWEGLRDARIFLTGGTGFFGRWLLEMLFWADARLALGLKVILLTRDAAAFRSANPILSAHPALTFHPGDIRDFSFPKPVCSHVIHAAAAASVALNREDPLLMLDTIVHGTRRALEFARQSGVRKFLYISSGAVYGRQPVELTHIPEEYEGAPDPENPLSAYGEGKRLAELLGAVYAYKYSIDVKTARCFAFVGPYLPLDRHFAVGNFIRDALAGRPISIQGDGTPYRSYLYGADLARWLLVILLRGKTARVYNVGSENRRTIAEIAGEVASLYPQVSVRIAKRPIAGGAVEQYVPSTERARVELGLRETVGFQEAIRRTAKWYSELRIGTA